MNINCDEQKRLANIEKNGFEFANVMFSLWESAVIKHARPDSAGCR